jgi:hypothetical protein
MARLATALWVATLWWWCAAWVSLASAPPESTAKHATLSSELPSPSLCIGAVRADARGLFQQCVELAVLLEPARFPEVELFGSGSFASGALDRATVFELQLFGVLPSKLMGTRARFHAVPTRVLDATSIHWW